MATIELEKIGSDFIKENDKVLKQDIRKGGPYKLVVRKPIPFRIGMNRPEHSSIKNDNKDAIEIKMPNSSVGAVTLDVVKKYIENHQK